MNLTQKDYTRIAVIRAVNFYFENVRDDEHALFIYEVMAEYPDDQVLSAIDINGAKLHWLYHLDNFPRFMVMLQTHVYFGGETAELNHALAKWIQLS